MRQDEPNPASAKEKAEGSRENVNAGPNDPRKGTKEFRGDPELDGKSDSGPEPDVHNREIPPQQ